jgi:hypothetical protein
LPGEALPSAAGEEPGCDDDDQDGDDVLHGNNAKFSIAPAATPESLG